MIRVSQTVNPEINPEWLTENSVRELAEAGGASGLVGTTTTLVYDDDKFLLAFSIRQGTGLFRPAEIFLIVGKAYGPRYLRRTKRLLGHLVERAHGLVTLINVDFHKGCRFAEFLGFRPRGEPFDYLGHRFQLYEVYP